MHILYFTHLYKVAIFVYHDLYESTRLKHMSFGGSVEISHC
jgi:hypothetical protein